MLTRERCDAPSDRPDGNGRGGLSNHDHRFALDLEYRIQPDECFPKGSGRQERNDEPAVQLVKSIGLAVEQ